MDKKEFPSLSFPNICKVLRKGLIKVNKKKVTNSSILKKDDLIKFYISVNIEKKKVSFPEEIISKSKRLGYIQKSKLYCFKQAQWYSCSGWDWCENKY